MKGDKVSWKNAEVGKTYSVFEYQSDGESYHIGNGILLRVYRDSVQLDMENGGPWQYLTGNVDLFEP